ncbi:MAG: 4-oxalocrotonate tautomerase [Hydrogenoanaerobacterium sp.]
MAETKNLCAQIPLALHQKVCENKEQSGLTLNQYVAQLITEYYELKEMKPNMATRTLALQISEELFTRIKNHVDATPHLTQKAFITQLITKALDELEQVENTHE